MSAVTILEVASTMLVNASLSWMVGTALARWWLRSPGALQGQGVFATFHRSEHIAAAVCLVALLGTIWSACAVMTDRALGDAGPMLWPMLSKTSVGETSLAGLALIVAAIALVARSRDTVRSDVVLLIVLAAFASSRASMSHAGEEGLLSLGLVVQWAHVCLISLWVGAVAVAGWVVLPAACADDIRPQRLHAYLESLSLAATIALAGIVATGLYNAWQRVGTAANLYGNVYGSVLLVKLAFVFGAAALGGYNKVFGFPGLIRGSGGWRRVPAVLRLESVVLLAALGAAAVLVSQQPPTAL
jgi:copper resistance protein D